MDTYLGLDFGGTKLLIGEADEEGRILCSKRYATGVTNQQDAVELIMESLTDYTKTVGFKGKVKATGLGIVGIVDYELGQWVAMQHEIKGAPVPVAELLERQLGIPCAVDNDVRSAVTAELLLGHGRKSSDFIYLNVGTGLAAGFVSGGKILRGACYNSGEIGHMSVDLKNTDPCICGRRGCAENAVSGAGFTYQVKKYGLTELLNEQGRAQVQLLFEKAEAGNTQCLEIAEYAADTLACVIMNLVRVTDPDTFIIGGGIMNSQWFKNQVEKRLHPETMRGVKEGIVLSGFDPGYAGLIGAVSLGMYKIKEYYKEGGTNHAGRV